MALSTSAPGNTSNPYQKISNKRQIATMQYPSDMGRYYIAFDFAEYGPKYSTAASNLFPALNDAASFLVGSGIVNTVTDFFQPAVMQAFNQFYGTNITDASQLRIQSETYGIGNIDATIALPIPPNLVDDQQLDYNAQNLLNVAGQATQSILSAAGVDVNGAKNMASTINDFQQVFSGKTVNPFLAMMFNGPRFKTHQFGWRFSPKTPQESAVIVNIVNTFKKNSLPMTSGIVFTYPNVVLISLYPPEAREKMYKFKPCVITQIAVNYAPSGTPSFFAGTNAPAEIELKVQLSEISIWTSTDFVIPEKN